MSGEQTPGDAADLEVLRAAALATQKSAEEAQAALNAADPAFEPPPSFQPPSAPPSGIDLKTLESPMTRAIQASTQGLQDGITAVTRENTTIKASQARLEAQRRRVNDVGKSEGKTVSLAKQLDFTEDLIAALDDKRLYQLLLESPVYDCKPSGFIDKNE